MPLEAIRLTGASISIACGQRDHRSQWVACIIDDEHKLCGKWSNNLCKNSYLLIPSYPDIVEHLCKRSAAADWMQHQPDAIA